MRVLTAATNSTKADPRWQAVLGRAASADGTFVFAVRTTGVYCRPSCGARRPRPENVVFFTAPAAARAAGFRACKRCAPDAESSDAETRTRLVAQVCTWIDEAPTIPRLGDLAARAGYSTFHLQRMFRAVLGISPRAYAATRRAERLRAGLRAGDTVTAAMHRAGYGSASRLHADAGRVLGMLPRTARAGGRGERIEYAVERCSLGRVLVAMTARGVCAILLGDAEPVLAAELASRFPEAGLHRGNTAFGRKVATVVACVDGGRADPGLPLDLRGTAFQQRVWQALCAILSLIHI